MPPLPTPPPKPPVTAIYEFLHGEAFLRFSDPAPDHVRAFLTGRGWKFVQSTTKQIRKYWHNLESEWPAAEAVLREAQIPLQESRGGVPVPPSVRRRKTGAAILEEERDAQAALAVTLAEFDWSIFPEWSAKNLVIKHKDPSKGFVPFVLNKQQLKFLDSMWDQWCRTGMVRKNVVKSRQIGFSTEIQGLGYCLSFNVPGVEALVTAHREDAAQAVFRRTRLFEQRCPEKKEIHLNSKHEIAWKPPHDSALRTAVAEGTGRSDTRQFYHASEPAHYTNAGIEAMGNVEASVPMAPGTFIIRETTALGKNHFKDLWDNAAASGFENFFTGFLEDETARIFGVTLEDERWATTPLEWKADEERLRRLGAEFGLSEVEMVAALCFRRQKIASAECQGLPQVFKREYPAAVEDAFEATGAHFFEASIIDPQEAEALRMEAEKPAQRFKIDTSAVFMAATPEIANKSIEPHGFGALRIWKHPERGEAYIIPGDFGRGRNVSGDTGNPNKLDYTTFVVVNEYTREEVAVWHGRMDPDEAADQMAILGYYYNTALLLPETNHYGMIVIAPLVKRHRYPRVFRKEKVDRPTTRPITQDPESDWMEFGWWTGATLSKTVMLHHMKTMVREGAYRIREPEAFPELRSYMVDKNGDLGAEAGKHDDRVAVRAIGCTYLATHPKARSATQQKKEPGFLSRAWAEKQLAALRRRALGARDGEGDYT